MPTALALALAAIAAAGLNPRVPRRGAASAGRAAAVAAGAVALAASVLHALSWLAAACLLLMSFSLLAKARWPRLATAADLVVAAVAIMAVSGFGLVTALVLLALACAWMAAYPAQRPLGFFFESSSAGGVMRRLLPLTVLGPVLLAVIVGFRNANHGAAAAITAVALVYGAVLFGVALLWVIVRQLDRRDAQQSASHRELQRSEERYRLLFEANPLPMVIATIADLHIREANAAALDYFGYRRKQFIGLSVLALHPPEDEAGLRVAVAGAANTAGHVWTALTSTGDRRQMEVISYRIEWEGAPARLAFVRDLTERLASERELRNSEEQIRALLESTNEGIFATGLDARCIWTNPAAVRMFGYTSAAELLGQNMHSLVHHTKPDGTPYPEAECRGLHATHQGQPYTCDDELLWRADGTSFPVSMRSAPLRRGDGESYGTVVAITDTTERKRMLAAFYQGQKMDAVGRLAGGVAHDFNNLLTVINGYTDLLLSKAVMPRERAHLTNVRKAGERAAKLTRQLLAFSRQNLLEPSLVDLNAIVHETEAQLRPMLAGTAQLSLQLTSGLGTVRADPAQLSQVLLTLVSNAHDAVSGVSGGAVTVATANVLVDAATAAQRPGAVPGAYVGLIVSDTGTGMTADVRNRMFEPFFTTKASGKGTGLGLATVYGIVKQSGGYIHCDTELGRGTTMQVLLPRLEEGARRSPPPLRAASGEASGRRILLVEDEDIVRELASEILGGAGFAVQAAGGASEAWSALEAAERDGLRFDLLLTDVMMPECNGRQLAMRILARDPEIKILFMSGYTEGVMGEGGELDPGLAFLSKPFTPESLLNKVREALGGLAVGAGA